MKPTFDGGFQPHHQQVELFDAPWLCILQSLRPFKVHLFVCRYQLNRPFNWELQERLECGRHAINCLSGGPVITHSPMRDVNDHMIVENPALGLSSYMGRDGNYDLTLLQHVLSLLTGVQDFQPEFRTFSHVLWTTMSPNPPWAIVVNVQRPCAQCCTICYGAQTGMSWNLDSLHLPFAMNIATPHTFCLFIWPRDARF